MPSKTSVVGWVVAGILGAIIYAEWTADRLAFRHLKSVFEGQHGQQQQGGARDYPQLGTNSQDQQPAKEYQTDCSKRDDSDLCAQRRMAKSAEDQAGLSELGLWLLGATLFFTAAAAIAAWRTVRTMQDTAKRELRAYLGIAQTKIETLKPGEAPRVSIEIKNFGHTPAYAVVTGLNMTVGVWSANGLALAAQSTRPLGVLNPQDTSLMSGATGDPLTERDIQDMRSGARYLFVAGIITYRDALNATQTTTFKLEYGGDHMKVGRLAYCREGNDAT